MRELIKYLLGIVIILTIIKIIVCIRVCTGACAVYRAIICIGIDISIVSSPTKNIVICICISTVYSAIAVSYTHLRAHET